MLQTVTANRANWPEFAHMLIFIDESGDPGFDLERGASSVFVLAMVRFANKEDAVAVSEAAIDAGRAKKVHKAEIKNPTSCENGVKDAFFEDVAGCDFKVRAIVVKKGRALAQRLAGEREAFREYFVNLVMQYGDGDLQDAFIIVDGSSGSDFQKRSRL